MNIYSTNSIAKSVAKDIETYIYGMGLLSRVFYRAKHEHSVADKIRRTPGKYSKGGKLIQDIIGVRIAVYFPDDLDLVVSILNAHFDNIEVVKDNLDVCNFGPTRLNMVFSLPLDYGSSIGGFYGVDCIDDTFEVQVRTVLSEGWHEVEHDLRYKCHQDWLPYSDLSRMLNGVLATLETSEWTMVKIFENLAWQHYKSKQWEPMLRNKFRLNFQGTHLSQDIVNLLDQDPDLAKTLFRSNRLSLLSKIHKKSLPIPITMDNICHLVNYFEIGSERLMELMPSSFYIILDQD